jgi:alpha-amylase
MNKKFFCTLFALLISLSLFSGCEKKSSQTTVTNSSPSKEKHLQVSNNGGFFSQNDLIYFILTDRFNDGDSLNNKDVNKNDPKAFHGGDLKGIIQKLDYIKSLGATAIWITPIVENEAGGYHGYWAKDFYKVDPHLGTLEDLQNLVKEAHNKNIKVFIDYVINHTGYNSPWLTDGKHNGWFHEKQTITNYDDPQQCENGWLADLPDLNQDNPEVSDYFIKNALWWIGQTGIDGMRLDTVKHVPKSFWNKFAHSIKQKHPNFYLLGEVWSGDVNFINQYHKEGIDGFVNYPLFFGIRDAFKPWGNISALANAINNDSNFDNPNINGIFIDNHDNKRFISNVEENGEKYLKQALAFTMTYPAIPVIYYGTEIAMEGGNDPDNRQDMKWDETSNSKMLDFYRNLVNLRQTIPALKTNKIEVLTYDSNSIVYTRGNGKDALIAVFNTGDEKLSKTIQLKDGAAEYADVMTKKVYKTSNNQLNINLNLNPIDFVLLQPVKK